MNTGHMMLAVGAMLLLSVLILNVNNNILGTNNTLYNTKFGILAVSLGTSVIEEASGKSFDVATDGNSINDVNLLTPSSGLGPAVGEQYPNFNDFDDYNGFTKTFTNFPSAEFKVACSVKYVLESNPSITTTNKTWHKRIDVFVTSPSMVDQNNNLDTIKLSSVCSYWYFR